MWTLRIQIPYAKSPRGKGEKEEREKEDEVEEGKTIEFTCYRRSLTNSYPVLVDELKPIFDLQKVGTHRVIYNNKLYMLQRVTTINPTVTLNRYLDDPTYASIKTEVQDIYAFRSAMAMAINSDSCINLVWRGNLVYPVSFYDTYPFFTSIKKLLPSTVIRRWFDREDLPSVYRRLLRVSSLEDYPEKIANLRNRIMEICERVDPTMVLRCCLIVERISDQLIQSFLTPNEVKKKIVTTSSEDPSYI